MSSAAKTSSKIKRHFEDCDYAQLTILSSWNNSNNSKGVRSTACQTSEDLFLTREMDVQTGRYTAVVQDQVAEKHHNISLVDYYVTRYPKKNEEVWKNKIADGFITVDCEVVRNPNALVETEFFLEYVDAKAHASTQTASDAQGNSTDEWRENQLSSGSLASFLNNVTPTLVGALHKNIVQKDIFSTDLNFNSNAEEVKQTLSASYYKLLTVDLEKKKILYPDWNKAQRYTGSILKSSLTRNKDRVYDIEYDDGAKLTNVKEEYIRLLPDTVSKNKKTSNNSHLATRLQEGVRVFAKKTFGKSAAIVKYLPSRIVKITKSGTSYLYDVECEGSGQVEQNLMLEDLVIGGLQEGNRVEAKRPVTTPLQCTGVCFNSTGNMVVGGYGRFDVVGWCDSPGALICWSLSSPPSDQQHIKEPIYVLDHSCCITSLATHPVIPSLIAAGSYNGEVIVWDLSSPDQTALCSPISEYSHQQPVTDLCWVQLPSSSAGGQGGEYLLASCGSDGKVLFWSSRNKLAHPVKGFSISKDKASSSRRQYPNLLGASTLSFSLSSKAGGMSSRAAQYLVLGLEDGKVLRCNTTKLFSYEITAESLKTLPNPDDVFPPLSKRGEVYPLLSHIGPVTCSDYSPFHRHLLLVGGSDGKVKLCHVLQRNAIAEFEPSAYHPTQVANTRDQSRSPISGISAVRFSPVRPTVFAVSSSDGFVYVYDLFARASVPILRLEVTNTTGLQSDSGAEPVRVRRGQEESVALTSIAFTGKRRELLAGSDWMGRVHIWRLPQALTGLQQQVNVQGENEQMLLERMGKMHGKEGEEG